ncbi:hypothetical protein [Microbulbifer aggregans]|uniref:hypothetical protein n=1 Tax=Microbulbifer aggregans TaxID=1769779 RepID=UPI001CFF0D98|nr:hypothetical protein [Microbulbifer aggregans]
MKYTLLAALLSFTAGAVASEEAATFDMKIKDGTVGQAVTMVNSFCGEEIEPLVASNPDEKLTLDFEGIGCEAAAKLIRDFDQGGEA